METNADVFIEISRNSHIKYEYDKDKKMLKYISLGWYIYENLLQNNN